MTNKQEIIDYIKETKQPKKSEVAKKFGLTQHRIRVFVEKNNLQKYFISKSDKAIQFIKKHPKQFTRLEIMEKFEISKTMLTTTLLKNEEIRQLFKKKKMIKLTIFKPRVKKVKVEKVKVKKLSKGEKLKEFLFKHPEQFTRTELAEEFDITKETLNSYLYKAKMQKFVKPEITKTNILYDKIEKYIKNNYPTKKRVMREFNITQAQVENCCKKRKLRQFITLEKVGRPVGVSNLSDSISALPVTSGVTITPLMKYVIKSRDFKVIKFEELPECKKDMAKFVLKFNHTYFDWENKTKVIGAK